MMKKGTTGIQRGQAITFRLPSDTPDHLLRQLQRLKETEKRNFSSKIAEFTLEGVSNTLGKERETVTIPLPKQLSKEQRNWLKHSHSEALIGTIVYQLLADPLRATAVLASLNSKATDVDEALYLQEIQPLPEKEELIEDQLVQTAVEEVDEPEIDSDSLDDDLMNFDWEMVREELAASEEASEQEEIEEDPEDLLGDFLSRMNK